MRWPTTCASAGRWASGSTGRSGCWPSSSPTSTTTTPRCSPSTRRWPGRRRLPMPRRAGGRTGCRRCVASPPTCTPSTRVEVPPPGLLRAGPRRQTPYLYSQADIAALVDAAGTLPRPLGAATYQTLIGLLAVTGMRVGEAIRLDRDDLDADHDGLLTVRHSKFGKSRLVPLHPSTVAALHAYLQARDRLLPAPASPALLLSTAGTRLGYNNVWRTFHRLVRQVGLSARSPSCQPRIHDYADLRVMPTLAMKSLSIGVIANVHVGIITGPRGRRGGDRGVGSGPAWQRAAGCGRSLVACASCRHAGRRSSSRSVRAPARGRSRRRRCRRAGGAWRPCAAACASSGASL